MTTSSDNFPTTVAEWRQKLQPTFPEGYAGSVMRFFSIYLTMILARTPLTANQITTLSVLVYMGGIALFAFNNYRLHLAGVGLVCFSIVLDGCDGEIARLKGNKSKAGPYVEPVSHDIQYGLLFIPITFGLYQAGFGVSIVYAGFFATIFKLWTRSLEFRFLGLKDYLGLTPQAPSDPKQTLPKKTVLQRIYFFLNRGVFSSLGLPAPFFICALFNRLDIFIWLFLAGFGLIFLFHFGRQVRYISRLHRHFEHIN